MLIKFYSSKPLEEIDDALRDAAQSHGFGVMTVHDLKQTMTKKGVEFSRECQIFEVCNPNQAKQILEVEMEISTMLPCRISVYEEKGQTVLATMKPTHLASMFEGEGILETAKSVEETMTLIMKEAAESS